MPTWFRAAWLLSLCGVAGVGRAAASALDCDCNRDSVKAVAPDSLPREWRDRLPSAVSARLLPLRVAGRWSQAADSIGAIFSLEAGAVPARERQAMERQLQIMADEADCVERLGAGQPGATATTYQFEPQREEQGFIFFKSTADELVMADDTPQPVRRAVCWAALAAQDLQWAMNSRARAAAVKAAQDRVRRWENFNAKGYSQFPLELVVNGLLFERHARRDRSLEPPPWQAVLFHPSVGTELVGSRKDFGNVDAWRRLDVAVVELAGAVVYNAQRTSFVGGSAVATFPSSAAPGIGVLLHLGRNIAAGPVWHRGERDHLALLASLDVRHWLSDTPEHLKALLARARVAVDEADKVGRDDR